jgi:hypothetical protein
MNASSAVRPTFTKFFGGFDRPRDGLSDIITRVRRIRAMRTRRLRARKARMTIITRLEEQMSR